MVFIPYYIGTGGKLLSNGQRIPATWNLTLKTYLSLTVFAIKSMVICVLIGNIKSVYEYYKCIQLGGKIHNMMT